MKGMNDQYDRFFEEIGYWDLHSNILASAPLEDTKHTFYSPEEYTYHQK